MTSTENESVSSSPNVSLSLSTPLLLLLLLLSSFVVFLLPPPIVTLSITSLFCLSNSNASSGFSTISINSHAYKASATAVNRAALRCALPETDVSATPSAVCVLR